MSTKISTPKPPSEQDFENGAFHLAEEEALSSGNTRLAILVGGILLLLLVGYGMLPAKTSQRISRALPSIMLSDATVTGAQPAEPATAATAPTAADDKPAAVAEQTVATASLAKTTARPGRQEIASLDARTTETLTALSQPVEEAAATAPAPTPEAPAMVTLSGKILNENGTPLAGATVLMKGTTRGTGTDAKGNYTLVVPSGDNTLVYGYGGYQDQEMRVRGSQPINVTLLPNDPGKRRRR